MNDTNDNIPWIEKYRPKRLNEMTQVQNLLDLFQNTIKTGDMTHYLFYGSPGTGKTSAILAMGREIFKEFFSSRVIEFNASDDRGINAVREKITNEAKKYVAEMVSQDGSRIPPYKIIILDEADSMTDEAQDALRVIIEQYCTVTRFCFVCNYICKITDAIKSRCSIVYFKKLNTECMLNKLNEIALKEQMNLTEDILGIVIDVSNGDMRKAIMLLQNVKYFYDFKNSVTKPLNDMTDDELKLVQSIKFGSKLSADITKNDIYEISANITIQKAHDIIDQVLSSNTIVEVTLIGKKVIAMGYPIDNVLMQLNKAILETSNIDDNLKARIINYSGQILNKMKNCANEYIQLSDYLCSIYGIKKGLLAYI